MTTSPLPRFVSRLSRNISAGRRIGPTRLSLAMVVLIGGFPLGFASAHGGAVPMNGDGAIAWGVHNDVPHVVVDDALASNPTDGDDPMMEPDATTPSVSFVIPRERTGVWNIDGALHASDDTWYLHAVEINDQRINPIRHRVVLDDDARRAIVEWLAMVSAMPACEPLAREEDERLFRVTIEGITYSEPALWFRTDASWDNPDDPCLAIVRFAAWMHTTWMEEWHGDRQDADR